MSDIYARGQFTVDDSRSQEATGDPGNSLTFLAAVLPAKKYLAQKRGLVDANGTLQVNPGQSPPVPRAVRAQQRRAQAAAKANGPTARPSRGR